MIKKTIAPTLMCLFAALFLSGNQLNAQVSSEVPTKVFLENLFYSGQTFDEITAQADAYFHAKYPDLSPADLCGGDHRDGDFVKYQRWCSFWRNNQNEDGTLADFTAYSRVSSDDRSDRGADCDDSDSPIEWTSINYTSNMGLQIDQGRTSSMAFHPSDPNTYYIGAAWGGLWKTTDGGLTNTIVNDDLPLAAVSSIILDPEDTDNMLVALSDIVWYGPAGIGVYKSNDGGATFEETDFSWDITVGRRIYYMDQDPSNPNHVMAATSGGLYKSDDFFETSELVQPGNIHAVKYSQTEPGVVYAGGSNGQFYKSIDGGDSFDLITDFGSGAVRLAVSLQEGSSRIAATNGSELNVSSDHGETFTSYGLPESNMVVEFAAGSETVLNVGNFEVYQSDDFGASFYPVTHWLGHDDLPFIHVDQRNVFVNPLVDNVVYFCNDGGIFSHNTTTNNFENLCDDLIITQYYDIAVSQSEELVLGAGSQDNGNVFRASDGSWDRYAQTGDGMGQDIDPSYANRRYWSYQYGALRRWEDGSNTNIAPEGEGGSGAWETPFKIDPGNSDRILVGYSSVYESLDHGDTWSVVGDVVSPGADLMQLAIAPSNPDKIYASRGRTLYIKELGESEWTSIATPIAQEITDLEVDPLDEDVVYICYNGFMEESKVFRSDDSGENWENMSSNLPNLPMMSLELYHDIPGAVFVGTYGAVYYTDTMSTTWRKYGCIPNTSVNDIEIQYSTDKIFIGTHGRGIFEAPITPYVSGIAEEQSATVASLSMFPNPTTNKVSIQGSGVDLSTALVQVTDIMGREVPVNLNPIGSQELILDCSALVEGNYIVTVVDENQRKYVMKLSKL